MAYPEAHAAKSGSVPLALFGKKSVRTAMSAAVAIAIGIAPALVYSSPAMAAPNDLTLTVANTTAAEGGTITINYSYEGNGGATYTLLGTPPGPGGAVSGLGHDYMIGTPSPALTALGDGSTTPITGTITIDALTDMAYESSEQFTITATGDNGDTQTTALLTITDGAAPDFTFTGANSTTAVVEPIKNGTTTSAVTAALPLGWTTEADYHIKLNTLDGTTNSATDYDPLVNTDLIIPKGSVTHDGSVTILGDGLKDSQDVEQLTVLATGPAVGAPKTATVKIKDDAVDAVLPKLKIADAASAMEGGNASFTVTADHGSDTAMTAQWSSMDTTPATGHGTATAGTDFDYNADATQRVVTVPATTNKIAVKTTGLLSIPLKTDTTYEQAEDFTVGIASPTNATLGTPITAKGVIMDAADLTASVIPISVDEGSGGRKAVTFTATLSQPALKPVTVEWKTDDAGQTATAGLDYIKASGMVTFPAGETKQTFTVDVIGDTIDEDNETFNIVTTSDFVTYAGTTTQITIKDDDAAPTFMFDNVTVDEGNSPHAVLIPIKLSNASSHPITYNIADMTSGAGAASDMFDPAVVGSGDYTLLTKGTDAVTIQAGQTDGFVVALVNGDKIYEKSEWAKFTATPNTATATANYLGSNTMQTSTLTISNDDKAPDLEINNVTGKEGETVQVTSSVTGISDSDTKLTVVFEGGASDGKRAASANDFTNPGATPITIPMGTIEGTVFDVAKVKLLVTEGAEPAETIRVTGYGEGNVGTVTEGVITIAANGTTTPEEPGGEEPGEAPKPTIKAPTKVTGPSAVEVEGTVAAGKMVQLWAAPLGSGDLKWVKNVTADEDGYYFFSHNISWGTRFAVLSQEMKSDEITVWVTQKPLFVVSTSSKGQLNLGVKGMPSWAGQTAAVQQWVNGSWVTKWSGKTGADGVWRASPKFKSGTSVVLRAWVGGEPLKGTLPAFTEQMRSTVK